MSGRGKGRAPEFRIPQAKPRYGGISPRLPQRRELDADWRYLGELPGFERARQHDQFRFCIDEDVSKVIVHDLRTNLGLNVKWAAEEGLKGHNDLSIRNWAKASGRILLTSNCNQFCSERAHPIRECPGIIAIGMPNDGSHVSHALWMLDFLLRNLSGHFKNAWWPSTKFRMQSDHFDLTMRRGGVVSRYEIRPGANDMLRFKVR